MKKKILLTARDYSSAINAFALSQSPLLRSQFKIKLALGYPANCLFNKHKPCQSSEIVEHIDSFQQYPKKKAGISKAVEKVEKMVNHEKPDILLAGVSGEGVGIDEIATKVCKTRIPTLVYQDYWGYLNPGIECIADRVLVMDLAGDVATEKQYPSLQRSVVGSLKYDYYLHHVIPRLYFQFHLSYPALDNNFWVFIGQPLAFINSYSHILHLISDFSKKKNVQCYYLPHPLEKMHTLHQYLPVKFKLFDQKKTPKEIMLLKAQKVFTVFSTYVTDILILKKLMKSSQPDIAVIDVSQEIHEYRFSFPGSLTHFPISEELIFNIKEKKDLEDFFARKKPVYDMIKFESALKNISDILLEF
jgi:hypothetical protein